MIFDRLKKQLNADHAPEPDSERIARTAKSFAALLSQSGFMTDYAIKSFAETVDYYQGLAEFWQGMYLLATDKNFQRRING